MKTAYSVCSGNREALSANSLVREANGNLYIPGSTIKGVLRHNCARFIKTLGGRVCGAPVPGKMCFGDNICTVCSLFGSPYYPSPLIYSNARLDQGYLENRNMLLGALTKDAGSRLAYRYDVQYRTRTQVSRARGVAKEKSLFNLHCAGEGHVFQGNISGWLTLTPTDDQSCYYEIIALMASIKMTDCLGSGKSNGLGAYAIEVGSLEIKGRDHSGLIENISDYLEDMEIWLLEKGEAV